MGSDSIGHSAVLAIRGRVIALGSSMSVCMYVRCSREGDRETRISVSSLGYRDSDGMKSHCLVIDIYPR